MNIKLPSPHLNRRGKIIRNLLVCCVLLFFLWGTQDYPLPTAELQLRQLEDRVLAPHSQSLYTWDNPLSVKEAGAGSPRHIVVGSWGDQYSVAYLYEARRSFQNTLEWWPMEDGPTPIPLSIPLSQDGWTNDSVLLLLQIPEETASARVTVTGRMANMIQPVETVEGTQLAQGVWEFRFPIDPELTTDYGETGEVRYEGRALEGLPYVLELYGADGTPLLERSDTLPDSGIEESYTVSFYDRREG